MKENKNEITIKMARGARNGATGGGEDSHVELRRILVDIVYYSWILSS